MAPLISSIFSALSGIRASVRRHETSAHHLANLQSTGFRSQRVIQTESKFGGTSVSSLSPDFSSGGPILLTGRSLDLALEGEGFFVVEDGRGNRFYTRDGGFFTNGEGQLVDAGGRQVQPPIAVPVEATGIEIGRDGTVNALFADGRQENLGKLETVRFPNPGGLEAVGQNLYRATPAAGDPAPAGETIVRSGSLEGSNVDLLQELTGQILALRSLEANVLMLRRSNEMTRTAVNLIGRSGR